MEDEMAIFGVWLRLLAANGSPVSGGIPVRICFPADTMNGGPPTST